MSTPRAAFMTAMLLLAAFGQVAAQGLTDNEVREKMVAQSIAAYPGSCPCPSSVMRNGRQCGKRSAWSKPGGYAPLCFPSDIDDAMVKAYRQRMKRITQ